MIAFPAIDLRDGACAQLAGGAYDRDVVRATDPVGVARMWDQYGFRRLHVVDLDAATGRGVNADVVRNLLAERGLDIQVGGGVRTFDVAERLLDDGARRVVVGTRAIEDPGWLADLAGAFPNEVIVAVEVRDRRVVMHGWPRSFPHDVVDAVEELGAAPLAGIMVTALHREGRLSGADLALMEDVAEAAEVPVYAAGGITTVNDLRALADRGIAAAVIGQALYAGVLDARVVAEEFAE